MRSGLHKNDQYTLHNPSVPSTSQRITDALLSLECISLHSHSLKFVICLSHGTYDILPRTGTWLGLTKDVCVTFQSEGQSEIQLLGCPFLGQFSALKDESEDVK